MEGHPSAQAGMQEALHLEYYNTQQSTLNSQKYRMG